MSCLNKPVCRKPQLKLPAPSLLHWYQEEDNSHPANDVVVVVVVEWRRLRTCRWRSSRVVWPGGVVGTCRTGPGGSESTRKTDAGLG